MYEISPLDTNQRGRQVLEVAVMVGSQAPTVFSEVPIDLGITVALTTFENHQFLRDNLAHVLSSLIVREIVISDDHSQLKHWRLSCNEILEGARKQGFSVSPIMGSEVNGSNNLASGVQSFSISRELDTKIIVFSRNTARLGGFRNKKESIALASNNWVLLLDADNILPDSALFAISQLNNARDSNVYCPSELTLFANISDGRPLPLKRKKRQLAFLSPMLGEPLRLPFFKELLRSSSPYERAQVGFFLNTGNFLVPRNAYLSCLQQVEVEAESDPLAADVVTFSSMWLKTGGAFVLVKGFEYFHRVHERSFWASTKSSQLARKEEKLITTLELPRSLQEPKRCYLAYRLILRAISIPSDTRTFLRLTEKKMRKVFGWVRTSLRRNP